MAAPRRAAICGVLGRGKSRGNPGTGVGRSALQRHQVHGRILASSVDFDVELDPIAFVEAGHAGTLNRTDVHESIRLAIITGDEAKTFHPVEELDRTGSLVTRQLTLRSSFALRGFDQVTHNLKVAGGNLAAAINQGKLQRLAFGQAFEPGALNRADVDEYVFAAFITLDEAKALARVEELYGAGTFTDHLSRHAAATRGTAAEAAATATTGATAETATVSTAKAAARRATKATAITAAKTVTTAKAITATRKRIEAVFTEPVALVTATAATSSIKTHKPERTFVSSASSQPKPRGRNAPGRQTQQTHARSAARLVITYLIPLGESIRA